MKSLVINVPSNDCQRLWNQESKVVLSEVLPKYDPPFKVYVYCNDSGEKVNVGLLSSITGNGKLIGEFVCEKIYEFEYGNMPVYDGYGQYHGKSQGYYGIIDKKYAKYVSEKRLWDFGKGNTVYALAFDKFVGWLQPQPIGVLLRECISPYHDCANCEHGMIFLMDDEEEYAMYHGDAYQAYQTACLNYLQDAPTTLEYVQDLEEDHDVSEMRF